MITRTLKVSSLLLLLSLPAAAEGIQWQGLAALEEAKGLGKHVLLSVWAEN